MDIDSWISAVQAVRSEGFNVDLEPGLIIKGDNPEQLERVNWCRALTSTQQQSEIPQTISPSSPYTCEQARTIMAYRSGDPA